MCKREISQCYVFVIDGFVAGLFDPAMFKRLLPLATLGAIATAASLHATVLTFNITPAPADDATIPADYGNRAASASQVGGGGTYGYGNFGEGFTPNVTDSFGTATNFFSTGYGALVNVAYANDGHFSLTFTGDAGFNVSLYSFDLAGLDQSYTISSVSVLSGATTLFSQSNVLVNGSSNGTGMTSFSFGPLTAHTLTVQFDASNLGANVQNVGIDNIRIGQVAVPEPSSLALIGFAGVASFFIRRRFFRA